MIRLKQLLEDFVSFDKIEDVAEQNSLLRSKLSTDYKPLGNASTAKSTSPTSIDYSGFQKFRINNDQSLLTSSRDLVDQLISLSKFVSDTTQTSYKELKIASDNFIQNKQLPTEQAWASYTREITRKGGPQLGMKTKWLKSYFMKKPDYLLTLLKKIKGNQIAAQQSAVAFAKEDTFRKAYMTPVSGAWQSLILGDQNIKPRVEATIQQLNQGYYDIAVTDVIITPVTNLNDGTNFILA